MSECIEIGSFWRNRLSQTTCVVLRVSDRYVDVNQNGERMAYPRKVFEECWVMRRNPDPPSEQALNFLKDARRFFAYPESINLNDPLDLIRLACVLDSYARFHG